MTSSPTAARARASAWSVVVLLACAAPRGWAALADKSVFIPQEIFDATDPAHRLAFGWGFSSTSFRDGAHSWVFPAAIAALWKVASALGVHSAAGLVTAVKLAMAALSLGAVWLAMGLARRVYGERAAVLTGLLSCAAAPLVAFGSRTFAETAAAPLVTGAVLLALYQERRRALAAGALLGLASLLHYEVVVVGVVLGVTLFAHRRRRDAALLASGLAGVIVLGGLLDWATFGAPFRSLVLEARAVTAAPHPWLYGRKDLLYYPDHLTSSLGVTFSVLLLGMVVAYRRARPVVAVVLAYLVAIGCALPRELRFVVPVLPLFLAIGAVGLARLCDGLRGGAKPMIALGLAAIVQMGWITHAPTRAALGFGGGDWNTWHSGEDYFRATFDAGKVPDLCGLVTIANEPSWTGGYTYLHRSVPIFFDTHAEHLAAANAVVGGPGEKLPAGWRKVATEGQYALWTRAGTCLPPPSGWTLVLP